MKRRNLLQLLACSGLAFGAKPTSIRAGMRPRGYDVLVIGAGVFGVWTAARLHAAGKRVAVIDSFGAAHSGASSGGESRVTRCGYGDNELYTEWACRSMADWQALSTRAALPLFHQDGVLWIHQRHDKFVAATVAMLARRSIPFTQLTAAELSSRYPVMATSKDDAAFLEPNGGALMARRAVQTLATELADAGVTFLHGEVLPVRAAMSVGGSLRSAMLVNGGVIEAEQFVFACGPWLDRVCPEAMANKLFVTRQEVFYFSVNRTETGSLPVWADLPFYGMPDFEGRGFKLANDSHGPRLNPDATDRRTSADGERQARKFLARRFPSLAGAPLHETRVCQYENSSNGDFVFDRHPGMDNVWIAGCGSGHGFKHGPAVGTHVAGLILGSERMIPRFSLASKATLQKRVVQ